MTKFNKQFLKEPIPDSGPVDIDIMALSKKSVWAKGFWISQYDNNFRLIRNGKKGVLLKLTISRGTARKLILANGLNPIKCDTFKLATSWKKLTGRSK